MSLLELYIWTRLDAFHTILLWILIPAAIATIVLSIIVVVGKLEDGNSKEIRVIKRARKTVLWLVIASSTLIIIVPTKDNVTMIAGVHWASNNEDVRAIPATAAALIRAWLDEVPMPESPAKKSQSKGGEK